MSDPDLKRALKEVLAADDALRAEEAETDRRLAELKARCKRSRGEVVHKTFDANDSHRATTTAQSQRQRGADWHAWFVAEFDHVYRTMVYPDLSGAVEEYVEAQLAVRQLPPLRPYVHGRGHKEGDVVTHGGSLHQALRDTTRLPGSEDWSCIVSCGTPGIDGRSADKAINQIVSLCREVERLHQEIVQLKTDAEVARVAKVIDLPNPLRRRHAAG